MPFRHKRKFRTSVALKPSHSCRRHVARRRQKRASRIEFLPESTHRNGTHADFYCTTSASEFRKSLHPERSQTRNRSSVTDYRAESPKVVLYLWAPTCTARLSKDQKREHTPRRFHAEGTAAALACSQGAIGCCSARRRLRAEPPRHAGRALFERHAAAGLVSLDDRLYGEQLCPAHRPAQY